MYVDPYFSRSAFEVFYLGFVYLRLIFYGFDPMGFITMKNHHLGDGFLELFPSILSKSKFMESL